MARCVQRVVNEFPGVGEYHCLKEGIEPYSNEAEKLKFNPDAVVMVPNGGEKRWKDLSQRIIAH